MRNRFLLVIGVLAGAIGLSLVPALVAEQGPPAGRTAGGSWKAPRTPWGESDLQGIWTTVAEIPVERPEQYAGREFLTDEEVAALDAKKAVTDRRPLQPGNPGTYNAVFNSILKTGKRTSLIVDPPDGKIPPLTAEALSRPAQPTQYALTSTDNPEDRIFAERCLGTLLPGFGAGPSGDGTLRLVQSPGWATIYSEYGHAGGAVRVIPTNGSPHLPSHVRLWLGDSRGRWEGETLVVDTTNFSTEVEFQTISQFTLGPRGSHENLHLVERFTRVDPTTLRREIRIEDPTTWTRPWTVVVEYGKDDEQQNRIFESACHEGNFGLTGVLAGARAQEKGR